MISEVVTLLNSDLKVVARIVELEIVVRADKLVCNIQVVLVIVELGVFEICGDIEGIVGIEKLVFCNTKIALGIIDLVFIAILV